MQMFATSKVAFVAIYAWDIFSHKVKNIISTHVPYYDDLFKSKNIKMSIRKTFWFYLSDKKRCVGD